MYAHHFMIAAELYGDNHLDEVYWSELMSRETFLAFIDSGHLVINHCSWS